MKSLLLTLFSALVLFGQSNAQTVLETPLFEKVKIDGRLIYHKDNVSCYSDIGGYYLSSKPIYTFLNFETGEIDTRECEELKSENGTGFRLSIAVSDDYLYELVEYGGTGFTTNCFVGIIKRDFKTMEVVARYDAGEFGIFNSGQRPSISMYKVDDGIFLIAGKQEYGEQRNFVSKIDLDLNPLWQNDFDYFSEDGISLGKSIVEGNNLITPIKVDVEVESGRKFKLFGKEFKTGLLFLKHDSKGESEMIAPTLTEDHIVLGSKYFYDEENHELVGFFLTIKEKLQNMSEAKQGVGYAYYRWDSEGNVKQSKIDYLTLKDLLSLGNLEEYMNKAELEVSTLTRDGELKGLSRINRSSGFHVDFLENGEIIVRVDGYKIGSLKKGVKYADVENSFLVFALNADGSKKWTQFFPASSHMMGQSASQIRGDQMFIYSCDYSSNFTDGEYSLNTITGYSTWKSIIPTVRSVNLKDGSVNYYEPITTDVYKKMKVGFADINRYDDEQFGVIVTHSDFKHENWKSRLYIPR